MMIKLFSVFAVMGAASASPLAQQHAEIYDATM